MKKQFAVLLTFGLFITSTTSLMAETNLTSAMTLLNQYKLDNMEILNREEASAIVLEQVTGATIQNMYLNAEDGCLVYEVNLIKGSKLYDVEMDARTGVIYRIEMNGVSQTLPASATGLDMVKLTWQQARTIATEKIGGGIPIKIQLDRENDRMIYEIDVIRDNVGHEFEIDANTGTILKHTREILPNNTASSETITNETILKITKDQAIQIARNKIGGGSVIKAYLDSEGSRLIYEVELISDTIEYEFEIDATTGTILKQDAEYINVPTMATIEVATAKSTKNTTSQLTRDEVKKIVREQVPEGTIVKMEMDYEHGKAVYEVDVRKGAAKYNLEIDATTGTVYKCEVDY